VQDKNKKQVVGLAAFGLNALLQTKVFRVMERVRVRKVVWLKFNALTEQMFAFIMGTDVLSGGE
jgi:hypothetical protein